MLYPVITRSRTVLDLCGIWKFRLDNGKGFDEKWFERELDNVVNMPVPSSYNDMKEDAAYRDHYGWVFYQRKVMIPAVLQTQRIVLRMDAVTHSARVYWNGKEIGCHKGGFLPFEIEINSAECRDVNLLTIAVDNRINHGTLPVGADRQGVTAMIGGVSTNIKTNKEKNTPQFDFFNYCGITRPVRIYTTPKCYIKDISVSNRLAGENAVLNYSVVVCGDEGKNTVLEIADAEGKTAAVSKGPEGELTVAGAHLWEPGRPYLYQLKISYGEDEYLLPYGIRTVETKGTQFLINGKPFYFKGYGKHEDTFPAGRGLNMPMNCKDISLMKWQGANSFRTSHYPYSEEMMRLCDEEGIVVIDETPAVGVHLNFGGGAEFRNGVKVNTFDPVEKGGIRTQEHHKEVIYDLIQRDKNHACVVMWSIANEPDSAGKGVYEYFKPLFELAHSTDPQKRPCTMVTMQVEDNAKDCSLLLSDVFCLNRYYGWYVSGGDLETAEMLLREELKFWEAQGKPVMFTEYGADTISGMHDTVPVLFTEEYQIAYYEMNHKVMDEQPYIIGEQAWNFADFATCQGIMRVQGNKKGIFTRERRPKMSAYYFRERWRKIQDFGYKDAY